MKETWKMATSGRETENVRKEETVVKERKKKRRQGEEKH